MSKKTFFYKFFHWEYWPAYMFYIPNLPYAFYLAAKAKNLVFYSAVNPSIKSSGNGTESKFKTLELIPDAYKPKSVFVKPNEDFDTVLKNIKIQQIIFPLIAKPDIGFRGLLVKKIDSESQLKEYLQKYPIEIIIQEFISYRNECGIFYHRLPNEKTGAITSITLKKFLTVIADGTSTLSELILNDNRAKVYYELLKEIHQDYLNSIPQKGEEVILTVIGNHAKGTQFLDGNHLISSKLTETIDTLSHQIDGWYYGRLDIKYDTFEKLIEGEGFKILEINGIISEPTHMYDASKYSYFYALREIKKHWKIIYEIAIVNHKEKAVTYIKALDFIQEVIDLKKYTKKLRKYQS